MSESDSRRMNGATRPVRDEMEQVRQLLVGDLQAENTRQIAALETRVAQLEMQVAALLAHGAAVRAAWDQELGALPTASGTVDPAAEQAEAPVGARGDLRRIAVDRWRRA
ncbi:MAG: hypothetical protein AAFQ35_13105, partial [Pseudomonadota bacterium]